MFNRYKTRGIVLGRENKGEADQLFTIFTRRFGKLKVLGRGIRKIKSKLRSGVCLFCVSEIEFIQGRIFKTLTDAVLVRKFWSLGKNPQKLEIAFKIAEAFDSLTAGEEKDKRLWQLLVNVFSNLNKSNLKSGSFKLEISYFCFLWNLFVLLGYKPEFSHCLSCGKELCSFDLYFSPQDGGVFCEKCFLKLPYKKRAELERTNLNVVKIVRFFMAGDWRLLDSLPVEISCSDKENIAQISSTYLSFLRTH